MSALGALADIGVRPRYVHFTRIEQALKARNHGTGRELTAARNTARPKNVLMPVLDHLAEIKRVVEECALEGQSLRLVEMFDSRAPWLARRL